MIWAIGYIFIGYVLLGCLNRWWPAYKNHMVDDYDKVNKAGFFTLVIFFGPFVVTWLSGVLLKKFVCKLLNFAENGFRIYKEENSGK